MAKNDREKIKTRTGENGDETCRVYNVKFRSEGVSNFALNAYKYKITKDVPTENPPEITPEEKGVLLPSPIDEIIVNELPLTEGVS